MHKYLYYVRETLAKKTFEDYSLHIKNLEKFLWNKNLGWSQNSYDKWVAYQRTEASRHQARTVARIFMDWAVKNGFIPLNYDRTFGRLATPVRRQHYPVTAEDYEQIKQAVGHKPEFSAVMVGYWTGMRMKDCCHLSWPQVGLDRMVIEVVPSKTGRRHAAKCFIPLLPNSDLHLALLEASKTRQPDQIYVFPHLEKVYRTENAQPIRDLFTESGISPDKSKAKCFHDLRRGFISRCINDGRMDWMMVAKMTGHKNPQVFAKYVTPDAGALRNGLEDTFGRQTGIGPVGAADTEEIRITKSNVIKLCRNQLSCQTERDNTACSK